MFTKVNESSIYLQYGDETNRYT